MPYLGRGRGIPYLGRGRGAGSSSAPALGLAAVGAGWGSTGAGVSCASGSGAGGTTAASSGASAGPALSTGAGVAGSFTSLAAPGSVVPLGSLALVARARSAPPTFRSPPSPAKRAPAPRRTSSRCDGHRKDTPLPLERVFDSASKRRAEASAHLTRSFASNANRQRRAPRPTQARLEPQTRAQLGRFTSFWNLSSQRGS